MSQIANIFHSLEGQWNLSRLFRTFDAKNIGTLVGIAKFQKSNSDTNLLTYREDGVFTNAEKISYKAYRDYLYRFQDNNISVFYAEKSKGLLHTLEFDNLNLPPSPITATAKHLCDCDIYDATYAFNLPDEFMLTYSVTPENYTITSIFKRIVQEAPSCRL